MFWVVKFIQQFFAPLSIFFGLLTVAGVLYFNKKKLLAKIVFAVSIGVLLFFSYGFGVRLLAQPLENAIEIVNPQDFENVKTVVVLGGGSHPDSDRPVSARLTNITVARLVEGIRVFNLSNAENLILTGANLTRGNSIASLMRQTAVDLGVDESRIITLDHARNTREEAAHAAEFVRGDTVFLVSSATHLKRAAKNFEREGIFVIPMPTDFVVHNHKQKTLFHYFPRPHNIENSGKAIHEYLGLFYEIFRR